MARLRDVSVVLRKVGPFHFALRVYRETSEDSVFTWASALAYSWLFAIFPFFIFVLTLLPYLPENAKNGARGELDQAMRQLPEAAYETVAPFVVKHLNKVLEHKPSARALLSIGIILTLWAASGGMAATMSALDRCYDIENGRPWWKIRLIAIVLTAVIATLLLAVILLIPVGSLLKEWFVATKGLRSVDWAFLWMFDLSRWFLALIFLLLAMGILYHFGVSFRGRWRFLTPGAFFCIVVWILLGLGLRMYFNRFGRYGEMYGTVGGVAVLLLIFYLNAVVLLVGAEINAEIDKTMAALSTIVRAEPGHTLASTQQADATSEEWAIDAGLAVPLDQPKDHPPDSNPSH